MKKLLCAALVLLLASVTVFAEVNIGGNAMIHFDTIANSTADGAKAKSAFYLPAVRLQANAVNEEGTFGGFVRLDGRALSNEAGKAATGVRGTAWWQPIPQFKAQLGFHDGFGVSNYVVGWAFHQDASDFLTNWASGIAPGTGYGNLRGGAFFVGLASGGDDAHGASITLKPVDGLTILAGIPIAGAWMGNAASAEPKDWFGKAVGQVSYDIAGIGTPSVSIAMGDGKTSQTAIFGAFNVTAIPGLGLNMGVKYSLGMEKDDTKGPFQANIGAAYTLNDMITLKGRFYGAFAGEANGKAQDTDIMFEVMPVLNLGVCNVQVAGGMQLKGDAKNWWVEPYVTKAVGGALVFAGARVWNDGAAKTTEWAIPVGLMYAF